MQTPDFTGMPNLEYLDLRSCSNLEEVHHSLGYCRKLIRLSLDWCKSLKRFPRVNVESLGYLHLPYCYSLEKFPEILGRMKVDLVIEMHHSGIRELPSIQYLTHITKLELRFLKNIVTLPSSIGKLKSLVELDLWGCSILESLPKEIGGLENLEKLDASYTLISQPPPSIVRLNKLKFLSFAKQKSKAGIEDGVYFVFPLVDEGLRSLEDLDLSYCNLIDGGLSEDIGCLSSLKDLKLRGNNFGHLPQSLVHLVALRFLDLTDCKSLAHLPELPPELNELHADCHLALESIHNLVTKKQLQRVVLSPLYDKDEAYNDSITNLFAHTLFQSLSSLQHDILASDSLSQRVFTIEHQNSRKKIPSWFLYRGIYRVSVYLPENWYTNLLGLAVCYCGSLIEITVQLIPLCDNGGTSWMTQKLALPNHSKYNTKSTIHFFFVPLAGLWDTSKANGKSPNDYGRMRLFRSGEMEFGLRLLYNDEPTEHCNGIRRSIYDNSEHHDSTTNEASCSSCKKQRSHSNIRGRMASVFQNFAALSCKPRVLT